ncbi:MAG: hypothetical protein IPJ19_14090 [Planctomycetes bacterium]|nr:hypothetical protein [Planctomycetota bacterium]
MPTRGRWLAKLLVSLGRAYAATGEYPLAESALLELGTSLFVTTRGGAHKDTAQRRKRCSSATRPGMPRSPIARSQGCGVEKAKRDAGCQGA